MPGLGWYHWLWLAVLLLILFRWFTRWPATCPGPLWGQNPLQTSGRLRDLVTLCHIMETSNLQIAKPIMACPPTHPTTWQFVLPTSTTRPATLLSLPPPGHHQHHTARQLINTAVKGNTKSSVN